MDLITEVLPDMLDCTVTKRDTVDREGVGHTVKT